MWKPPAVDRSLPSTLPATSTRGKFNTKGTFSSRRQRLPSVHRKQPLGLVCHVLKHLCRPQAECFAESAQGMKDLGSGWAAETAFPLRHWKVLPPLFKSQQTVKWSSSWVVLVHSQPLHPPNLPDMFSWKTEFLRSCAKKIEIWEGAITVLFFFNFPLLNFASPLKPPVFSL